MAAKKSLLDQALQLPEDERLEVGELLYQSVEGPPDADAQQAWSAEIARRIEEINSGRATLIPWKRARREIMGDDAA